MLALLHLLFHDTFLMAFQILEWFGVASVSYLAALPLALIVELPFQRLHKALQQLKKPAIRENGQKTDL